MHRALSCNIIFPRMGNQSRRFSELADALGGNFNVFISATHLFSCNSTFATARLSKKIGMHLQEPQPRSDQAPKCSSADAVNPDAA